MIDTTLEKIWERYQNKYRFLVLASRETRKLIEAVAEGRIETIDNPYRLGVLRTIRGEAEDDIVEVVPEEQVEESLEEEKPLATTD